MIQWHLINNDGDIIRTVTASSRADAVELLGRNGTVVSALSWKLDYHRWRPVKTVVTDQVQPLAKKLYTSITTVKPGYLRVAEIAAQLQTQEGKVRRLVQLHDIPCEVVRYKGRKLQTYSPKAVARIKKAMHAEPDRTVPRSIVAKRRHAYLERMRQYYLQKAHSHKARRAV